MNDALPNKDVEANKTDSKKKVRLPKSILIFASIYLIFLICISFVLLNHLQDSRFFKPWHDEESYNQLLRNESFEEIKIDNNGQSLCGWLKYNTNEPKAPLIIYFEGNSENSSYICMKYLKNNTYDSFKNYNFLVVDYPGYGLSDGKTSDTSMFEAALKVYDYACNLECVDNNNIVIFGYSIGTGVATYLASQRDVNGLILISPYDEALSLYNDTLNIFHGPLKLLAKYKFCSKSYAPNVEVPALIFTSLDDETISCDFSINLAKYFNSIYEFVTLKDVKHNGYIHQETVLVKLSDYLQNRLSSNT